MVSILLGGFRQAAVVNLTVQCSGTAPDAKPPCSAAMADGVRGQFVDGQDYVHHSVFRKACL